MTIRLLHCAVVLAIGTATLAWMVGEMVNRHHDGVMAAMVIGCPLMLATDLAFCLVRGRGGK